MAEKDEEKIKAMVDRANQLSKEGNNLEALGILEQARRKATFMLPIDAINRSEGLVYHYMGRVEQAMGDYKQAVTSLEFAIRLRDNDPVAKASKVYSVFQRFICKIYGKLPITDEEVEETKMALTAAMASNAATIADIGNMMQNLAYVEQVRGDIEKAILFYEMTLAVREKVYDVRGRALTYARLAECYKEVHRDVLAKAYAGIALEYFEDTNDVERVEQVRKIFG